MTSLTAAIHQDLVAIVLSPPGASVVRVGIYQPSSGSQNNGNLQTTLMYKVSAGTEDSISVQKLVFVNTNSVAALLSSGTAVLWDLQRSVVAHTFPKESDSKKKDSSKMIVLDAVAYTVDDDNKLYCLVTTASSEGSGKMYVYQYDVRTGSLARKVKCGKRKEERTTVGLAIASKECAVVRIGSDVRALSLITGQKEKVKADNSSSNPTHLASGDRRVYLATSSGHIHIYSSSDDDSNKLKLEGTVPTTGAVESWQLAGSRVLVNASHVYDVSSPSKSASQPPLMCHFHVDPKLTASTVLLATAPKDDSHVWAVLQQHNHDGNFQFQKVPLATDNKKKPILVEWKTATKDKVDLEKAGTKRKAREDIAVVQAGGEALQVSEIKKAKVQEENDDDENDDTQGKRAQQELTIAERLQQLQSAMMDDDDDEDDDKMNVDEDDEDEAAFAPQKATTESLTRLLQQALESGDDGLLELALRVQDRQIIATTCQALSTQLVTILLTALTSRLALKPGRADALCVNWLPTVLKSHTNSHKMLESLQTLRNVVQERVELFPSLLQLEGKMSML